MKVLAEGLGYVIGLGALFLYTPIIVRLLRRKSAHGLTVMTWWLNLYSYTCTELYAYTYGYPLSMYIDSVVATVQVVIILGLTAYYQNLWKLKLFRLGLLLYFATVTALLVHVSRDTVELGQVAATSSSIAALLSQIRLNHKQQTSGDYSPITAFLVIVGSSIRLFTVVALAGSDGLLLFSFSSSLVLNVALLVQMIYLGVRVENMTVLEVLMGDIVSRNRNQDESIDASLDGTLDASRSITDSVFEAVSDGSIQINRARSLDGSLAKPLLERKDEELNTGSGNSLDGCDDTSVRAG